MQKATTGYVPTYVNKDGQRVMAVDNNDTTMTSNQQNQKLNVQSFEEPRLIALLFAVQRNFDKQCDGKPVEEQQAWVKRTVQERFEYPADGVHEPILCNRLLGFLNRTQGHGNVFYDIVYNNAGEAEG